MPKLSMVNKISKNDFLDSYVGPQKPVVFTDLFAGQPIDELRDENIVAQRYGDMQIRVFETYEHTIMRAFGGIMMGTAAIDPPEPENVSYNEYLSRMNSGSAEGTLCSESPPTLWGSFADSHEVPEYCLGDDGKPIDYIPELWLGRNRHYTHMHYDTDGRNILLHQIFGRKRILIAPPSAAKKFGSVLNISLMCPEGLSDAEFEDWAEFLGAYWGYLDSGQTVFMPAFWWHSVEYFSNSMAIVMRHRQNDYIKEIYRCVQPNNKTQMLATLYADPRAVDPSLEAFVSKLTAVNDDTTLSDSQRLAGVKSLVDDEFDKRFPELAKAEYVRPFLRPMVQMVENMAASTGNFQSLRFNSEEHELDAA